MHSPALCPVWLRKWSVETVRTCLLPTDCVNRRLRKGIFTTAANLSYFCDEALQYVLFPDWILFHLPTNKILTSGLCHIFQQLWSLKGNSIWTFSQLWGNDGQSMAVHSGLSICKAEEPSCTMKAFKQAKVFQDGHWQLIFVGHRPRQSLREQHRRLPFVQSLVTIW